MSNNSPVVVIYDDDIYYAQILKSNLLEINERVEAVNSFEQFNKIDLSQTKCLVLDFYLNEQETKYTDTALNVLTTLRAGYPNIKVILHSAIAQGIDIYQAHQYGAYRIIPKGDEGALDTLIEEVKRLLNDKVTPTEEGSELGCEEEVAELKKIIATNEKEIISIQQNAARVSKASREYIEKFQSVIQRVSNISTSGQRPGMLLDSILSDFIKEAGAKGGAWFLLTQGREKIRNQNCEQLGRSIKVPKRPELTLGSLLWSKLEEANESTDNIIGPIDVNASLKRGVFQGSVVICVFNIESYGDELLFILEYPTNTNKTELPTDAALRTYVIALQSMLDLLPVYIAAREFGSIDKLVSFSERQVSKGQMVSRGFMSLLSLFLFVAAIISSVFAFFVLITSTLGFPDVFVKGFHWHPEHYGIGVVHALEIFILAITLYLLGVGLSCMIDHPRLSRVPPALRYLDNPAEMKRSLTLAICTLIAVAGLKFILEFEMPVGGSQMDWIKGLITFGSKIVASVLLLLTLTLLLGKSTHRADMLTSPKRAD